MRTARLGDHVEILSGFAFDSKQFGDSGEIPLVRIRDVVRGRSNTYYRGSYDPRWLVDDGDILIGMDGEFNCAIWQGGRALLNQRVCRVRPTNGQLDDRYLFHFLPLALRAIEDATPFVTVKHLSVKHVREIEIPLPPTSEQRRIAQILDRGEQLRTARRAALDQVGTLAESVFVDMFGDPTTNAGRMPLKRLDEVCSLINGRAFKPDEWDVDGLPIIRIQNLNDPSKPYNYSSRDWPEKFRVRAGDVLFSWSGTPGTSFGCFRWDGPEGWLNQHIFNVRLGASVMRSFFIVQLNLRLHELIAKAHGGVGLQHVTKRMVDETLLVVPPLGLQHEFEDRVGEVERLGAAMRASGDQIDTLRASLLDRAFRGEL